MNIRDIGERLRQWPRRRLVASAVIAVCAAMAVWAAVTVWHYVGHSDIGEARWVYLPTGMSREAFRDSLTVSLGEPVAGRVMRLWSLFSGKDAVPHGAYRVSEGMSAARIYRRLATGAQTPVRVTFNNVRTMPQLASRIADKMEFTPVEFLAACDSVLSAKGFTLQQYPAAFFPDTYEFYWTESPARVVGQLSAQYDHFWTAERRAKAEALSLSPIEVATVASIAEEETNDRVERGTVARLYLNRLNKGMRLQADPTVKFAVGDFSIKRVLAVHLAKQSPYNTYINRGLPPGPIRVVNPATLDAVLDAPANDYIYMCAKEDFSGRHNFTADYREHLANARRYQAALNARNIK
ncbi:MAG: endolytic transglycosylase MltG [Pseudoflavonifractor sp.]|nr:endolytic transglycosylase MltG [Pseudoflavonifractor sp.]